MKEVSFLPVFCEGCGNLLARTQKKKTELKMDKQGNYIIQCRCGFENHISPFQRKLLDSFGNRAKKPGNLTVFSFLYYLSMLKSVKLVFLF